MNKRNKTHIFFPNTNALILCNQKGNMLKAMNINDTVMHIQDFGTENICKKCLSIYLNEGENIKEINLDNFKRID